MSAENWLNYFMKTRNLRALTWLAWIGAEGCSKPRSWRLLKPAARRSASWRGGFKTPLIGVTAILFALAYQFLSSAVQAQWTGNPPTTSIPVAVSDINSSSAKLESEDLPPANRVKPASAEMVLPADLSPAVAEIAKLVQAHMTDDVILSYIRNSGVIYRPTADEIVYLNDLGVSKQVLTELIERGKTTWGGNSASEANAAPMPAATLANAPSPSYSVATEQPAPTPAPTAPTTVIAAPVPPVQSVTVAYFQESLSPYGTWVWIGDYGWCWRPTVVVANPEWRPYCDRGGGYTPTPGGIGNPTTHGVGQRSITDAGRDMGCMGGYGCRIPFGGLRGFPGAITTPIAAGRRCRLGRVLRWASG